MGLRPSVLEQLTRHMVWRHLHPDIYRKNEHVLTTNQYYADAVYAPIYYGFGEPGSFADRRQRAREWDNELLSVAPDTVLVLVRASAEVIAGGCVRVSGPGSSSRRTTSSWSWSGSPRSTVTR